MSAVPNDQLGPPATLTVIPENIPADMKALPQWVGWRWKHIADQKKPWTKPPVDPKTGGAASVTNPATWGTFDQAMMAMKGRSLAGIGFVLTHDSGYIGGDIDNCVDAETGAPDALAMAIVTAVDTYAERSPTIGLRFIAKGDSDERLAKGKRKGRHELYTSGRYVTLTGHRLDGAPSTVEERTDEISALCDLLFLEPVEAPQQHHQSSTTASGQEESDEELLERAFASKNGANVRALFDGDTSAHGEDDSRADLALCCHLAFWLNRDANRIDSAFRQSRLMRPKWDEKRGKSTYGALTIAKALKLQTETYSPRQEPLYEVRVNGDAEPGAGPRPERLHWPVIDDAAYHGIVGDLVWALDPYTEADPVAVLLNAITYVGNAVGRGPHIYIGEDRHACNIFVGFVGETSKGRKGTAGRGIDRLMTEVDREWAEGRKQGGASSGEGILSAIRDETYSQNKKTGDQELDDPGVKDKRLLLEEEEFSFQLKAAQRQGNTITEIIRRGWDSRSSLRIMTKQSPLKATHPLISMIVHITKEELARNVAETEMANGFLNRYIWILVRRSKFLAFPKRMDDRDFARFVTTFAAIKEWASNQDRSFEFDEGAAAIWSDTYQGLAEGAFGLAGAMTARAAPIVRRLSLIYAVLDMSPVIRAAHLEAALAVWDYAEQSVKHIFGDLTGDAVADRILAVLRQSGSQTQSDLSDLFGRNVPSSRLGHALEVLLTAGMVTMEKLEPEGGKGRPRTLWSVVTKENHQ